MQQKVIGWDVGGAHIKAAVLEADNQVSRVFLLPCPLWKGLEFLKQAVLEIVQQLPDENFQHAITMTGELVDLFDSRDQGVEQIIQVMQESLVAQTCFIYAGNKGFLIPQNISQQDYEAIASANWLASASWVASKVGQGIFIDIGSTTSDILVLANDKVKAIGLTDYQRLQSDELVYTGIIRTAVMAVSQQAYFKGQQTGLMAEYFATMADVYRLTGELNEAHDRTETADGAEKTVEASAKRLSRMVGYEYEEKDLKVWQQFAQEIKSQQKDKIKQACIRQLSRNLNSTKDCFVGAGVGRFLVKQVADELGYAYRDFTELFDSKMDGFSVNIADCAPAVAVAALLNPDV